MDNETAKGSTSGGSSGTSGSDDKTNKTYDKEFVDKLLTEKNNYKAKADKLEKEADDAKRKSLESANDYKAIADSERQKREALEKEVKEAKENTVKTRKKEAVTKSLLAIGLEPKYLETALKLVNTNNVHVDPETQTVYGADDVAKEFYKENSGLGYFKKAGNGKGAGGFNPNNAAGGSAKNLNIGTDIFKNSISENMEFLRSRAKE